MNAPIAVKPRSVTNPGTTNGSNCGRAASLTLAGRPKRNDRGVRAIGRFRLGSGATASAGLLTGRTTGASTGSTAAAAGLTLAGTAAGGTVSAAVSAASGCSPNVVVAVSDTNIVGTRSAGIPSFGAGSVLLAGVASRAGLSPPVALTLVRPDGCCRPNPACELMKPCLELSPGRLAPLCTPGLPPGSADAGAAPRIPDPTLSKPAATSQLATTICPRDRFTNPSSEASGAAIGAGVLQLFNNCGISAGGTTSTNNRR